MKLTFPMRGWIEASFSDLTTQQQQALELLAGVSETTLGVPGVKAWRTADGTQKLRAPVNIRDLDAWNRLLDASEPFVHGITPESEYFSEAFHWPAQRTLMPHQTSAVKFICQNGGALLADTMGLGKTLSAITAAETLAYDTTRPRLILGPKYTRAVWLRELLAAGAISTPDDFAFAVGRDPHAPFNFGAKYWFIHYDIAYAWINRLSITPRGPLGRPLVAILDECHWLRNPNAQRTKGANALALLAPHRILLTGTPLVNRPSELWQLLSILQPGAWGSRFQFRVRYAGAMETEHGFADGPPTRVEELSKRIKYHYLRRDLDSAGVELPKLRRVTLMSDLSDAETAEHAELVSRIGGVDELVRAVLERRAGTATLALISKLRKLTSAAKAKASIDLIVDTLESGQSIVVFAWQRKTVTQFVKAVSRAVELRYPVTGVHGAHPMNLRDLVVEDFQRNGGALISTLDALKEGVTLTRATHVLIHDLSWVPVEVLQGEARVYRIGQTKPVIATWALAENSIDMLLARVITEKARTMQEVLRIDSAADAVAELGLPAFLGDAPEHNFGALFKALGIEVHA